MPAVMVSQKCRESGENCNAVNSMAPKHVQDGAIQIVIYYFFIIINIVVVVVVAVQPFGWDLADFSVSLSCT
jgi:hypothetical protein